MKAMDCAESAYYAANGLKKDRAEFKIQAAKVLLFAAYFRWTQIHDVVPDEEGAADQQAAFASLCRRQWAKLTGEGIISSAMVAERKSGLMSFNSKRRKSMLLELACAHGWGEIASDAVTTQ